MKKSFWTCRMKEREAAVSVIEIILILVVLIALVVLFKDQITALSNSIFDNMFSKTEALFQ